MAQYNDNNQAIKKVNYPQRVKFTVKAATTDVLMNTPIRTIKPVTKIPNSNLKLHAVKAIDSEK